jgi:septal ring factor EnvC (AmiA/AmiB activator)
MKFFESNFFLVFFIILSLNLSYNYSQDKQDELEKEKKQLEGEIKKINLLLFSSINQKKSLITEVEELSIKINLREKLIIINNKQANILTGKISANEKRIEELEEELKILKNEYSQIIQKSNRSKSDQSRLMFLFSSESFLQAYKRFQYLKQYMNYRKKQGELIVLKYQDLKNLNQQLFNQKELKEKIVLQNKKIQLDFEKEKKNQDALIRDLKFKEKSYKKQIELKQKKSFAISLEIKKIIEKAIRDSNKKAGGNDFMEFALTPEAKLISNNFVKNKGNLPWPVDKGVIIQGFGKRNHPVVKSTIIQSNGVIISTPKNTIARAIFNGKVLSVLSFKGSNPTILIQHGNYITTYSNLEKIYVKKGEKVEAKQPIGEVFTNPKTLRTDLKFSIFKSNTPLNPKGWIYML